MKGPRKNAATPLSKLLLVAANVLIPIAILTFATGFFPYKPLLPGLAVYDDSEYGPPPTAPFDKVVFMVVDALRRYSTSLASIPYMALLTLFCNTVISSILPIQASSTPNRAYSITPVPPKESLPRTTD